LVFGFFADRHIYLARKADILELETLIENSQGQGNPTE